MSVRARLRSAARHQAVHRGAVGARSTTLGHAVDADLRAGDVRLTHGRRADLRRRSTTATAPSGTPTALGPTKRALRGRADGHACARTTAAAASLHFGQGKWYPGEPLPRWSLDCFWRRDGEPIWHDPALLADERDDHGATAATTRSASCTRWRSASASTRRYVFAGLRGRLLLPVARAPAAGQRRSARFAPRRRARARRACAASSTQGLDEPVGYALPLAVDERQPDALALDALVPARRPLLPDPRRLAARLSPAARLAAVGARRRLSRGSIRPTPTSTCRRFRATAARRRRRRGARGTPRASRAAPKSAEHETPSGTHDVGSDARRAPAPARDAPEVGESAGFVVRTALCAEPRDGRLYIFMPPRRALEDYLELVAAVEATAEATAHAGDARRLRAAARPAPRSCFSVTPDPGVIEVNIHPASTWDELVEQHRRTSTSAARETRLTTEKFMLDGRHTGTGGGNHFVLGGATPADSPVPAPARPAAQPDRLLAQPSVAVATCSRACSSARRARRRASTRRATTRSTSSRSRSPSSRASPRSRPARRRRGWSTACSATC